MSLRLRQRLALGPSARRRIGIVTAGGVGAALAIALAGQVQATIGPFEATFAARPALQGITTVHLSPLGTIELDTHSGPVELHVRVDELRPDEAERIARDPALLEDLDDEIADDARRALTSLLFRVLAVGTIGGGLGVLVAVRGWRPAGAGVLVGAILATALTTAAVATLDTRALGEPRYTGLLTRAPAAVGDVQSIVGRFDDYRAQLSDLVINVAALYEAGMALPDLDPGPEATRILHVSDLHNNPQGYDLVAQLAAQFEVDAIVDTGDLTDWGSEPEAALVDRIGQLGVPYVYVRGNHDSEATQAAVARQPNAVVLDGAAANVAGLRIWGVGDPRYTPDKEQGATRDEQREVADAFADDVARLLEDQRSIDVVLVHDARTAADIGDLTPLVLAGHTHEPRQDAIGDADLLVEGSTGGAGLRGLQDDEPHPLTASILYFGRTSDRLIAYDRITVEGLGGASARIERHLVTRDDPRESALRRWR